MREKDIFGAIMAGGSGTRFWPRSRDKKPKQFLSIIENKTLIQNTIDRFLPIIPEQNLYVISKELHKKEISEQKLTINNENIIYEPVGRNTLPCIGLAALFILRRNPEGIMVVSPSDHLVGDLSLFKDTISASCEIAANNDVIITIGINPHFAATGYGYIHKTDIVHRNSGLDFFKVINFAEKPDRHTAEKFLASGDYLWNSGIFIFRCSVLMKAIVEFSPKLFESLMEINEYIDTPSFEEHLSRIYNSVEVVSIDNGILEKAHNILVVKSNFLWNDIGGWEQVYELSEKDLAGNAVSGNVVTLNTENSYIYTDKGLIVLMGLKDMLVVQEGNATLVTKRNQSEEIKKLVTLLKNQKFDEYI